ncbi:MAG: exo-alpha-sialidase, partial [Acidobacteriales bacterium]|nr:exo-alpha-sialidase [Terriglobales bacterium]
MDPDLDLPQRPSRTHRNPQSKPTPKPPRREPEDEDHDFPALREDWFRAGRTSQSQKPAAQLRHEAIAQRLATEYRLRAHSSTPTPNWQELGPRPQVSSQYGNLAGRITAIAIDTSRDPSGNTVYVGTAYGGLWKTSNGMSANPAFTPLTENAPTLSVGSIALDASTNPTTIYIGSGEPDSSIDSYYGVGVLKSTDGGTTWTTSSIADAGSESFYGQSFSKLLVDPNDPELLIACTRLSGTPTYRSLTSGIFRSIDYGATWQMMYEAPNGCSDLTYQPSTNTYFAAIRGVGVLASKQGGSSWVMLPTPFASGTPATLTNTRRIALASRNTELWALLIDSTGNLSTPVPCPAATGSCDTGLSVSNDGGYTWTSVNAPPTAFGSSSQGWYDLYIGTPGNSGAVVLGGIDLWWGQWDGTANIAWSNLTNGYSGGSVHPDQHAFAALDAAHWYIGNDGGLWTTTSSGQSWTNANASIGAIQFTSVSADPILSAQYFGGSQDNGTAVSLQNSSNWNTIYAGDGGYTLAATKTAARYLTENYSISLRRTDDRGTTFNTIVDSSTIADNSGFYVPYQFSDSSESSILLGTCRLWRGPT